MNILVQVKLPVSDVNPFAKLVSDFFEMSDFSETKFFVHFHTGFIWQSDYCNQRFQIFRICSRYQLRIETLSNSSSSTSYRKFTVQYTQWFYIGLQLCDYTQKVTFVNVNCNFMCESVSTPRHPRRFVSKTQNLPIFFINQPGWIWLKLTWLCIFVIWILSLRVGVCSLQRWVFQTSWVAWESPRSWLSFYRRNGCKCYRFEHFLQK